jgi:L-lysine exporter family protein LysE/ArgO
MLAAAVEGFLLGAGLIVAIGAQNAFVLRQGLRREHVFAVATVCWLSDALLIVVGVAGVGELVKRSPELLMWVTGAGILFLAAYGTLALVRAFGRDGSPPRARRHRRLRRRFSPCSRSPSSTPTSISTRWC